MRKVSADARGGFADRRGEGAGISRAPSKSRPARIVRTRGAFPNSAAPIASGRLRSRHGLRELIVAVDGDGLCETTLEDAVHLPAHSSILRLQDVHRELTIGNARAQPSFIPPLIGAVGKIAIGVVGPRGDLLIVDGLLEGLEERGRVWGVEAKGHCFYSYYVAEDGELCVGVCPYDWTKCLAHAVFMKAATLAIALDALDHHVVRPSAFQGGW